MNVQPLVGFMTSIIKLYKIISFWMSKIILFNGKGKCMNIS